MSYRVENEQCEVVNRYDRQFKPFAVPAEAEYRGNTYVGGSWTDVFERHDGVPVEVYSTPRNQDDPDGMVHYRMVFLLIKYNY